jgi:hypothetical protein
MATSNLFQNRETYSKYYGDFRGVDFSSDHTNVSERRLAYAVNMYKDYFSGQATGIETIPGFRKMLNLKSKIYGIHYYKHKDSASKIVEKVLIHAGKKLYLWSGYPDKSKYDSFDNIEMNERKSTSFVFNNRLYIIDGKNYLVYDGENIKSVIDEAYVPTTRINMVPSEIIYDNDGKIKGQSFSNKDNGQEHQQRNLLSHHVRNTFIATGKTAKYYLSDVYLETLRQHKARHESKGNGFGYEIRDWSDVAGAIVCGGMGRERNLVIDKRQKDLVPTTHIKGSINKEGVRKMTPREWARLQGFPDSFELPLADTHLYKQFGNSVTVNVIEAIALKIKEVLDNVKR